ncbi:MAG: hypothetical protein Q9165_004033 [Trypethelium subeluteriae]
MAKDSPALEQVVEEIIPSSGLPRLPTEVKFRTPARPEVGNQDPRNQNETQSYGTPSTAFTSPFSPFAPSSIWDEEGSTQDLNSLPSSPPPNISVDPSHRINTDTLTKPQDPASEHLSGTNPSPLPGAGPKQRHQRSPALALSHQPLSRKLPSDIPHINRVPCLQCAAAQLSCDLALPSCSRCARRSEAELCLARRWVTAEEARVGLANGKLERMVLLDFGPEEGADGIDEDRERERKERRREVAERMEQILEEQGIAADRRNWALPMSGSQQLGGKRMSWKKRLASYKEAG